MLYIKMNETYPDNNGNSGSSMNGMNGMNGMGSMGGKEMRPNDCTCLDKLPLAIAYVPFQKWSEPYDAPVALNRGTIFPQLDKPFIGEEAVCNG